jgi:hypothetical protein
MEQPIWNFEQDPSDEPLDDTSINLRAYFDRIADDKLQQYSKDWTDEEVKNWDGNFTSDDTLLMLCCMRDVEMDEYRKVIEQCIEYRNRVRPLLQGAAAN